MEIGASLLRLDLFACDPERSAAFHAAAFGMTVSQEGDEQVCRAPGRELRIAAGEPGQLRRATFGFPTAEALQAYRARLLANGVELHEAGADRITVQDPNGRAISFTSEPPRTPAQPTALPAARLQHFALRTPDAAALVAHYVERLGFTLSDRVLDAEGDLTAAFLRTDSEHHSLAIFRSPVARFDHFSCEADDWQSLRDWADHMSHVGIDLAWGIGRHGPGNDTFLMVRDPDGNMGEISCDLEVCEADRPVGVWPHRPQTLNRWGLALMRS
jgi:catechol 2,3-dioxygenase